MSLIDTPKILNISSRKVKTGPVLVDRTAFININFVKPSIAVIMSVFFLLLTYCKGT